MLTGIERPGTENNLRWFIVRSTVNDRRDMSQENPTPIEQYVDCICDPSEGFAAKPNCYYHGEKGVNNFKYLQTLNAELQSGHSTLKRDNKCLGRQNERMREALESLVDGLDSNHIEEGEGLSSEEWDKRIKEAKEALEEK